MRRASWYRTYLVANIPLVIAVFAFPAYHTFLWGAMGWGAVAAVVIGTARNRPPRRLAWILVAIALACFISGDVTYDVLTKYLHESNPFPSLADVFYNLTYPLFACGLILMVRARRAERDLGALLDALTVTAGAALLSWIYLIQPYVHASSMTVVQRFVAIAYPLGDILILCVLARLLFAGKLRNPAMGLLSAGAVGLLTADCIYGWIQLHGNWKVGGPTDLGWVALYVLSGAAALHPSMRNLTERQPARPRQMSMTSLVVLSLATLIGPLLLVWRAAFTHKVNDGSVIGGVAGFMFLLVMARLTGLARSQAALARREQTLREVGERLLGATGVDGILAAAIDAVSDIIGGAATVCLASDLKDGREVVLAANRPGLEQVAVELDERYGHRAPARVWLAEGGAAVPGTALTADWISLLLPSTGGPRRRILAAHTGRLSTGTLTVLDALATQVTLALERAELVRALHRRVEEARFRSLIQNASEVILVMQANGHLSAETPSVTAILGYPAHVISSLTLGQLLAPNEAVQALAWIGSMRSGDGSGVQRREWAVRHADGSWIEMEVTANDLSDDPHIAGVVLTLRDVRERNRLEGELRHRAFHDTLTDLPNRELFRDRVQNALARRDRQHTAVSVLILDLDDFKLVNDTLGHVAGDELLVEVGRRLKACLREDDSAARLGGDEFAVCTGAGSGSASGAQGLAERILGAFTEPFHIGQTQVSTNVSIGVSVANAGTSGPVDMLREADLALYAAKSAGKHTFRFFERGLQDAASARLAQRGALEAAIANNQLCLHYQPVLRLTDRRIVAVEALVRWQHPELGLVPPAEFIPLAEESGLVVPLGVWVLDQACADLKRWSGTTWRAGMLKMAVNVSPRQLNSGKFLETVEGALLRHGVRPEALTLEITEGVLVQDDLGILASIQALADRGVTIALDDFGTGYSALSYLHRFPLKTLKIDRAFVADMDDPSGRALIDAIIAMARSLSLDVVAEGIELETQARQLEEMGCQYGQGYLFAKPMPAAALETLLQTEALAPTSWLAAINSSMVVDPQPLAMS